MKGTCHVHIGLHKTGSTSIQKMLAAEETRLAAHNFYRPSTGRNRTGIAHHLLADEVIHGDSGSSRFAELGSELEARGWPANVVLSSEGFCARIHRPRTVALLKKRIEQLGYHLRVIAFVRPQESALHSFYTQKLKMWTYKGGFDRFWQREIEHIAWNYEQRFAALFDAGVALEIIPFSRALLREGLCRRFLQAIGLSEAALQGFVEPPAANISPGPKAIAATLAINRELRRRGIRERRKTLETAAQLVRQIHRLIGPDAGRFNALSPETAERIRERFRDSNERFASRAFGRSWDDVFAGQRLAERPINEFDPAAAPCEEREAFEKFVAEAADAICDLAIEEHSERAVSRRAP